MAVMNLLRASWTGKVGQTVGAKWKDKATIRTYAVPTYTDTPGQQSVRGLFRDMSRFLALFSPQIRQLSALSTRGMSVRNAIIHLNRSLFENAGPFDPADIIVSAGGLPAPTGVTLIAGSGPQITFSWTPVTGTLISSKAICVGIAASQQASIGIASSALNTAGLLNLAPFPVGTGLIYGFLYLIDFRGSAKVGSPSVGRTVTK